MSTDSQMSTPANVTHSGAARSRRTSRASGDDRERAILQTAERLLEKRSFGEISVDDLARGAGISRPTFYFYFSGKDAVLLTLVDGMVAEAARRRSEVLGGLVQNPRETCRKGLEAFYDVFGARRAVILAAAELGAVNSEARAVWSQVTEGWVSDVTAVIESERARGAAPAGTPARELATALVQMNERVLRGTFAREEPSVAEDKVIDVLLEIWLSAIYRTPNPT